MVKKFRATTIFKDKYGKDSCSIFIEPLDLEAETAGSWVGISTTDSQKRSYEGLLYLNSKTALKLSKYFKELSKELK